MAIDSTYYFDDSGLALRLKGARQRYELTLEQLSLLTKEVDPTGTGISRVALSRYENGSSLPGVRELRLLSFALRRPLAHLVYGDLSDPMSTYRLELEMRIMEVVGENLSAEGMIKGDQNQDPETDEFKALVASVKKPI
jgi:transcriptional regulator with XRE-family HTH domain